MDVVRMEDDLPREKVPGNRIRPSLLTNAREKSIVSKRCVARSAYRDSRPRFTTLACQFQSKFPTEAVSNSRCRSKVIWRCRCACQNWKLVKRYRLFKAKPGQVCRHVHTRPRPITSMSKTLVRNLDDKPHHVSLRQEGVNGISLEGWWYAVKLSPDFFSGAGARDVMLARKPVRMNSSLAEPSRSTRDRIKTSPITPFSGLIILSINARFANLGVVNSTLPALSFPIPSKLIALDELSQGAARAVADVEKIVPLQGYRHQLSASGSIPSRRTAGIGRNVPSIPLVLRSQGYRCLRHPTDWGRRFILVGRSLSGWRNRYRLFLHTFIRHRSQLWVSPFVNADDFGEELHVPAFPPCSQYGPADAGDGSRNETYQRALQGRYQQTRSRDQALYKKYKLNPMASCLQVFIQLPIFIGLYRCVSVDIGLRQQPLIPGIQWCSNLAGPDMLATLADLDARVHRWQRNRLVRSIHQSSADHTIALFIIQQKVLMPKATTSRRG